MKSFGNLVPQFINRDNIREAIINASQRKRYRKEVRWILDHIDKVDEDILYMLCECGFVAPEHESTIIKESCGKEREVIDPTFSPEQIIHHALIQVIRPCLEFGMYAHSLGSVPGRGLHMGKELIEKMLQENPKECKYFVQLDIHHFFESIDHDILKDKLRKKFREKSLLKVMFEIIDGHSKGLPLGFYTSQWFANFLLQDLDHFIVEQLKFKHIRYMDDIVFFGRNKKVLRNAIAAITSFITINYKLQLKLPGHVRRFIYYEEVIDIKVTNLADIEKVTNTLKCADIRHFRGYLSKSGARLRVPYTKNNHKIIQNTLEIATEYKCEYEFNTRERGEVLDFMGFQFYPDKTILRKRIMLNITRLATEIGRSELIKVEHASAMLSYNGWFKVTDSYNFIEKWIKPNLDMDQLREIVSYNTRISLAMRKLSWHVTVSNAKPCWIDKDSDNSFVYLAKDIQELPPDEGETRWIYNEAVITFDLYRDIGYELLAMITHPEMMDAVRVNRVTHGQQPRLT